jgi:hypothetical protein
MYRSITCGSGKGYGRKQKLLNSTKCYIRKGRRRKKGMEREDGVKKMVYK